MSEEEQTTEEAPEEKPVEHNVFLTADCGCRFQIVSAMPVLNAGVLHMPDIMENVCEVHRARQEEAQEVAKEQAKRPTLVNPEGRVIVSSKPR